VVCSCSHSFDNVSHAYALSIQDQQLYHGIFVKFDNILSLKDLIQKLQDSTKPGANNPWFLGEGVPACLLLDKTELGRGAFKRTQGGKLMAFAAKSDYDNALHGNGMQWVNVAVKSRLPKPNPTGDFQVYNYDHEYSSLVSEGAAHYLAGPLIREAYKWIDYMDHQRGSRPPFDIPQFRLVEAGLFFVRDPCCPRVFLVEERLEPSLFRKFVNNNLPVALPPLDGVEFEKDIQIGKFLCFMQHVIWKLTGGLMYLSDFQGEYSRIANGGNYLRYIKALIMCSRISRSWLIRMWLLYLLLLAYNN
jgi:hypothetical protein